MSPDTNPFGVYGLPSLSRAGNWTAALLSGYSICPADCEVLELFEARTPSEICKAVTCLHCSRRLESVILHAIFI